MNWKKEIKELEYPCKTVELLIDNVHKVSFQSSVSKMKVYIQWYYNGKFKTEYLDSDNEIGKLFGKPCFNKFSKTWYNSIKKMSGKKAADRYKEDIKTRVLCYSCFWGTPSQIIKHLSKFEKIEILSAD